MFVWLGLNIKFALYSVRCGELVAALVAEARKLIKNRLHDNSLKVLLSFLQVKFSSSSLH